MLCRALPWLLVLTMALPPTVLSAAPAKTPAHPVQAQTTGEKIKEVAGSAEFLRSVPKYFATLQAVDPERHRVTLLIEGEKLAKVWPVTEDAEIKIAGWWGRLDQLTPKDRVWVWFQTNRQKQAVAVAMLADEPSEQDIHGRGVKVVRLAGDHITIKPVKGAERTLQFKSLPDAVSPGAQVYLQSQGERARLVLSVRGFEELRDRQKSHLRRLWCAQGLPGTVIFPHRFSGEMELMLDHEAMRWGRSLKLGDKVTLSGQPPLAAVVKKVRPWRERTQVQLVVNSFDLTDLRIGQRTHLQMTPPSAEVEKAVLPPDVDRPRGKSERVEWFLASIYCTCKIAGDVCTGHFYTLASCNPNGCGMPNHMRQEVRKGIEQGLTDRQIFEQLRKDYGPNLLRPHLEP